MAAVGRGLVLALRAADADHRHQRPGLDEGVRDLLRLLVEPARVAAQVHDDALDLLALEQRQRVGQVARAVGREVLHVEVADLRRRLARPGRHRQHAGRRIDGGRPDERPRDGELLHARRGVALDVDVDIGIDVATQALDRLVQGHVHRRFVVDADDVILGLDADPDRGRIGHRPLDRDPVLLVHLDDDAETAELPLGLRTHVLVGLDVEQHRVRVERVEHAVGGRHLDLDQAARLLLLGDRLQIGLHELEDLLQLGAQAPGRVHAFDRKAALLAVDLDRDLLGIVLGPAINQDFRHVALDEIQRAHQHPLRIQPVLVEVVLAHVKQRLREDRELAEVVFARQRARRGAQLIVGPDTDAVVVPHQADDSCRAARDDENDELAQPPHAGLRRWEGGEEVDAGVGSVDGPSMRSMDEQ